MTPVLGLMDLGPHAFWSQPGLWAGAVLALLAAKVPGPAGALGEEERRLLVRRILRNGAVAWLLFHGWAVWKWFACMGNLRILGTKGTPGDWALTLDIVGRWAFSGWACLGGAVVLAGIADRQREARWMRGVLLALCVVVVAGSILFDSTTTWAFETGKWIPAPWEQRMLPALGLGILVGFVFSGDAVVGFIRARRRGDAVRAEDRRRLLAGAGVALLCTGVMFALIRGFGACETVVRLGPKLRPADIDYLLWTSFRAPAVPVLLGLLATVFGLVHLVPKRGSGENGPAA